uniref:HGWP repeat containing protein-like n=1 Tax=Oryza sativa subsp. japonica TaxID=39947 RepID=Q6EUH8_ORYSJ|nr:HGWP repeat containing protein-like [Oryza sativa Japonica Group]
MFRQLARQLLDSLPPTTSTRRIVAAILCLILFASARRQRRGNDSSTDLMVVLVHHQAYWSNLPNEDAMVLQDGSTNTKHAKTDLIGCIGDGCSHADAFLPSCVVLMDTNAARDCDLRLLRSVSESVEEINLGEFFPFNL